MGARTYALMVGILASVCGHGHAAHADDCQGHDADGGFFAICFDPGNRVHASVASNGYGVGVDVRHTESTDDPDVYWRLEHGFASAVGTATHIDGTLYAGRYMRHSRDGHILLPLGPPKKIFLPFDIGAQADVGHVERRFADDRFDVNAIRATIMLEFTRSAHFRRRLAIGPVTRWDIVVPEDVSSVEEHRVTPFSAGVVDSYLESEDGLFMAHVRIEAGSAWSSVNGWRAYLAAEAELERILIAINDQPLSVYASASHRRGAALPSTVEPGQSGLWQATVGARFALSWAHPGR